MSDNEGEGHSGENKNNDSDKIGDYEGIAKGRKANPTCHYSNNCRRERHEHYHRVHEKIYWIIYISITICTLVAAIATACFAKGAYDQTKRQADTAVEALEQDGRPWIGGPTIEMVGSNQADTHLLFHFTNVGKSAPSGLYTDAIVTTSQDWLNEAKRLCAYNDNNAFHLNTIIPQDNFLQSDFPSQSFGSLDMTKIQHIKGAQIIGCIAYEFRSKPHKTLFRSDFMKDPKALTGPVYTLDAN